VPAALLAALVLLMAFAAQAVPHQGHGDSFDRHCLACQVLPGTVALGGEAFDATPVIESRSAEPSAVLLPGCLHRPETVPQRGPPIPARSTLA